MGQRGEAELDDLPGALAHRAVDGGRQGGQVEGQHGLGAGGQQLLAVQAVVGRPLGSVRLHDALKVAAESVLGAGARTGDQDGGLQSRVVVVKKCLRGSGWRGQFYFYHRCVSKLDKLNALLMFLFVSRWKTRP